ncbi:MAG: DNA cytosine methyltransferase [Bradyrhizobium sp.]|uniref:DNA cytosine methyltransferase n=1 Tax=Bradyrhizobium sp. TaxID=376 RepID=UPI001A2AC92E|nr:DNA cytosine methyltransferase [Bradyrhizobium sp.]
MSGTFVDLFSGAGLFSAGMMKAGFRPVVAVEMAKEAAASYRRNVSECIVAGSVTDLQPGPRADVLIAGPPCQGFSTLGRRDPSDERNELSLAILPWIRVVKPQVVVIENVPPFVTSPHWAKLARALRELKFNIAVWELDASDYGTPQRRRRAFTVASRASPIAAPRRSGKCVSAGDILFDKRRPLRANDPMHIWPRPVGIAAKRLQLIPPRGDRRDILAKDPSLCPPSWFKIGCNATDAWGRIDPEEPANTIRCTFQNPSKGRYLHPTEDRVLSLREGARLQDVPDDWIFEGRPYPVARQIGNGVPIKLATAVARAVSNLLR